ncbi:hypothetical protein PR048_033315 [Dryococelus australis]|uniref:Uncharacterized protein n=1 Tax=Dryococelus australis TaxID=614101 RepID=A0ABQ9FZY7_9NEOP|nr:hypothetical protein PR048_033315 [Dryococelus australis]
MEARWVGRWLIASRGETPHSCKRRKSCKETCIVAERNWAAMASDWGHNYLPKSKSTHHPRPEIGPGSPCWEASRLAAQPPQTLLYIHGCLQNGKVCDKCQRNRNLFFPRVFNELGISGVPGSVIACHGVGRRLHVRAGVSRPEQLTEAREMFRLACTPPIKAIRVQSPDGSLLDFRKWNSCRTKPLVGGFSRGSPVSPFILALLHSNLISPSPVIDVIERTSRAANHKVHWRVEKTLQRESSPNSSCLYQFSLESQSNSSFRPRNFVELFGSKIDSTTRRVLEPQLVVHWLMIQLHHRPSSSLACGKSGGFGYFPAEHNIRLLIFTSSHQCALKKSGIQDPSPKLINGFHGQFLLQSRRHEHELDSACPIFPEHTVIMELRFFGRLLTARNERAGETGDPRENQPTNGIICHDSHMR